MRVRRLVCMMFLVLLTGGALLGVAQEPTSALLPQSMTKAGSDAPPSLELNDWGRLRARSAGDGRAPNQQWNA